MSTHTCSFWEESYISEPFSGAEYTHYCLLPEEVASARLRVIREHDAELAEEYTHYRSIYAGTNECPYGELGRDPRRCRFYVPAEVSHSGDETS